MWRPILLPLALLLPAASLTACAADEDDGGVVASFYPLQYVAQRIVGDHATVTNLTAPGIEPHDVELSPRQAARVSGASVVFYEKGLQPAVDDAVRNDGPDHVVDAAEEVHLRHPGEHTDEHTEEGAEHGDADPHFWLDPTLLAEVADAFTAEMKESDPAHAVGLRGRQRPAPGRPGAAGP